MLYVCRLVCQPVCMDNTCLQSASTSAILMLLNNDVPHDFVMCRCCHTARVSLPGTASTRTLVSTASTSPPRMLFTKLCCRHGPRSLPSTTASATVLRVLAPELGHLQLLFDWASLPCMSVECHSLSASLALSCAHDSCQRNLTEALAHCVARLRQACRLALSHHST